ncbi:type III secretion system gatekeeper subunit SctW [Stenotrophomonas indicatrix]|uniref:type III secretion system gatekeeper subunit SctW n=1 Tax=Stenotrophomonas indicatrix TaxID=2045451 RepID=UPI003008DF4F
MNDDLSGLVSSMRRARSRDDGTEALGGYTWMDHVLDEQGPQKVAQLRQQLREQGVPAPAILRSLIEQFFPDASDALAVLRSLIADDELRELQGILGKLHEEMTLGLGGKAARAGLNVALKARLQAARLKATPGQLRRSYQDFLADLDPLDTYELWIDLYGFERRAAVIDFVEQALAADMYGLDPSCSRLEFGRLLQAVRTLTALRSADQLLQLHCWSPPLMARLQVQQRQLLAALIAMVRSGGGLQALFANLLTGAGVLMDSSEKVNFAQSIRRFLKALPHGLWADIGLQLQALAEVEALLDRALIQERLRQGGMHRVVV